MRLTTRAWAFLVVSPAVLAVALWTARRASSTPPAPTLFWDDDLRAEVQAIVQARYVDPVDERDAKRLFDAALEGYVAALDPFSRYVAPEETQAVERETQGAFAGVGVRVSAAPAGLRVTAVRRGGPAETAGVEPGDVVEKAAGVALAGRDLEGMLSQIRGEPGTRIDLVVRRGEELRTFSVVRAELPLDTVPAVRTLPGEPAVGYLRIEQFTDATTADVREALESFRAAGAGGIVLDLRGNLGGVVKSAVEVASFLLPPGSRVGVARRRTGGEIYETKRPEGFEPLATPLVVLVDESTASASEILAGALQDHGRAALVGERTWGKFLVQSLVRTQQSDAIVRLTTARYETARGRSAPRDARNSPAGGLQPDVRVPLRSEAERARLRTAFDRQSGPHWRTLDGADDASDRQLDAALSILRGAAPPPEPVARRG